MKISDKITNKSPKMLIIALPAIILPELTLFCFTDFRSKRRNLEVKSYDLTAALQKGSVSGSELILGPDPILDLV